MMAIGGKVRRLPSHLEIIYDQHGAALLMTLMFLLLLTIIGVSSLYSAYTEAVLSRSIEADARAFYRADSGIAEGLFSFNYPDKFGGKPPDFFKKQMNDNTSFFNEEGVSQYTGTKDSPDIIYPTEDFSLSVYAPSAPGAICTITSTGMSGKLKRTITAELFVEGSGVKIRQGTWRLE